MSFKSKLSSRYAATPCDYINNAPISPKDIPNCEHCEGSAFFFQN